MEMIYKVSGTAFGCKSVSVKVRHVGNSDVITFPSELSAWFAAGSPAPEIRIKEIPASILSVKQSKLHTGKITAQVF